ncbi:MAG: glutamine--fructose-6-phosphate transaminase (isomerizing) [Burkholderiaceae bacterium]|jgi:glucosamine--fructose-6-phosphate aminotransferase (isomerizing)|nr:glutamine--fructose-6-phosphate transaminase (isomerizing) [Burkholderiaceae bacterium]
MCGIVGGLAASDVSSVMIEGLRRLEYRGYDSCGVAFFFDGGLRRTRSTARVADLEEQVKAFGLGGRVGIAHTRWATHGAPTTANAHPHFSRDRIALVHNGIIENYAELREELLSRGYVFSSQTDTEVLAHLIDSLYEGDLLPAVQGAVSRLTGAFAIAVICRDEPQRMVGAREGSPLVVGLGKDGNFLASDAMALAGTTNRIIYLDDGDVVDVRLDAVRVYDVDGVEAHREIRVVPDYTVAVELGPYRHYMQKEIFEQPRALADTLQGIEEFTPRLFGADAQGVFEQVDAILILACGTSYYAGLIARYWIESKVGIPVSVEIASEYLYRDSVPNERTLVVTITQSGETADTLSALRHARSQGMRRTLTICNVATSAMVRECALAYITRAGHEIAVASTKAFTTQLVGLFLLTMVFARLKGRLGAAQEAEYLRLLRHLPAAVSSVLALEPQIIAWADVFARYDNALFLGRGMHYPVALEGALKLKEVSYIHAEAYPAGELKHGPLALVTEQMPVITIAPKDDLLEKLKSNMAEVRSRGGQLYVFADSNSHIASEPGIHVIRLPENYGVLSPILHVIPLQLLAYHTALARGTDADKPRNLAKSVTVE